MMKIHNNKFLGRKAILISLGIFSAFTFNACDAVSEETKNQAEIAVGKVADEISNAVSEESKHDVEVAAGKVADELLTAAKTKTGEVIESTASALKEKAAEFKSTADAPTLNSADQN